MNNNELFKSMKNQMMPSDDCVNDLLAKIAALDASEVEAKESAGSNVVQFEPRTEINEVKPARVPRRTWGFATAAVAAAICLVSVFGTIGDNPEDISANISGIIDNPEVIVQPENGNENPVIAPSNGEDEQGGTEVVLPENEGNGEDENAVVDSKKDKNGKKDNKDNKDNKGNDSKDEPNGNDKESKDPSGDSDKTDKNDNKSGEKIEGNNVVVEDDKIAPSEAATNELTWTREILADSAVKEITVEGSNYVVDSVSSISTGSKIQTIYIDVPETDTTSADTVEGDALKVSNVSKDLAVAVDVNEYEGKLVYLNSNYSPDTLGQFLSDAGIANGTAFTSVVYTGDRIGYNTTKRISKSIKQIAVDNLFVEGAGRASASSYNSGTEKIVFVSKSNPTGTTIQFGVSNSGYFKVILANGNTYTFAIDEEQANAFIDACLE